MKILSIGTGAIGTYICGSLSLDSNEIVFLEKENRTANLLHNGLTLQLENHPIKIHPVQVVSSLEQAFSGTQYDLAILAIKAYDTDSFIASAKEFTEVFPPVLCLQNGVENEGKISQWLGDKRIIPGTVTSSISKFGDGHIRLDRHRGVGISAHHTISTKIIESMHKVGLNPLAIQDPVSMKWSKMLTNLLANASSAILNMTPSEIFSDTRIAKLEIKQLRETLNVMKAIGISPIDLPKSPVKLLAFIVNYLPATIAIPLLKSTVSKGRGEKMPSFHIDLHSGKKQSEIDYLNGAVVRHGKKYQVLTPVNQLYTNLLLDLVNGKAEINDYTNNPTKLLEQLPLFTINDMI